MKEILAPGRRSVGESLRVITGTTYRCGKLSTEESSLHDARESATIWKKEGGEKNARSSILQNRRQAQPERYSRCTRRLLDCKGNHAVLASASGSFDYVAHSNRRRVGAG